MYSIIQIDHLGTSTWVVAASSSKVEDHMNNKSRYYLYERSLLGEGKWESFLVVPFEHTMIIRIAAGSKLVSVFSGPNPTPVLEAEVDLRESEKEGRPLVTGGFRSWRKREVKEERRGGELRRGCTRAEVTFNVSRHAAQGTRVSLASSPY